LIADLDRFTSVKELKFQPDAHQPDLDDYIPKVAELKANGGLCPICGYRYVKEYGLRYYSLNNGSMHREFHRQHVPRQDVRLSGFPNVSENSISVPAGDWVWESSGLESSWPGGSSNVSRGAP
jgi:hypothetical protein